MIQGTRLNTYDELACLPLGVEQVGEGVCLIIKMGPYRIMLDCGLNDLAPIYQLGESPADLVLCSHAHPDHAQGLLQLNLRYPQLPIYASEVTTQLLPLNWPQISAPQFCQALSWRSPVEFHEGLVAELYPAGHIPGATVFVLTYTSRQRTYSLIYTGDFFLSNSRLVEGLPLDSLRSLQPDVLIIEGSYGTTRHPHRRQQENKLAERVSQALINQQSVIFPVPTIGLGQELLMLLRSHHLFTGRDVDIWVDGNVARACNIYLELLNHFPSSVQNFARHQSLFWDEKVRPHVRSWNQPDKKLRSPCIIITDEGANLSEYLLVDPKKSDSSLLLVPDNPLKNLVDKFKGCQKNNLKIETFLLSEHSDGIGITQLIHNIRPQHVIFIHGSPIYLSDLTGLEELQNRYHLHSPRPGTLVELPVSDKFVQPSAPDRNYEGELNELDAFVTISLPNAIASDPRWDKLADTGLIQARWQGEELVIKGLSQKELFQGSDRLTPNLACCGNCKYQRGLRCGNQKSPLFGYKVTPEGFCSVFESLSTES